MAKLTVSDRSGAIDRRCLMLTGAAALLSGCAGESRIPYSASAAAVAEVPGFDRIRIAADADPAALAAFFRPLPRSQGRPNWLALSGGGSGGAFGAGFLLGWERNGTRPMFDLVTGVSAGALIAPYAFLGVQGDGGLKQIFTPESLESLAGPRNPLRAIMGQSLYPQGALAQIVATYVDATLVDQVAQRHRSGARLLVQTTSLDSERGYIWDLGRIAASSHPERLALFRQVLTASASIPAVFSAQRIKVEVGGRRFEELHADGAVTSEILTVPTAVLQTGQDVLPGWKPAIYIIFNESLDPRFKMTRDRGVEVGARALSILSRNAAVGDLTETLQFARRRGLPLKVTSINRDLGYDPRRPFGPEYIGKARALGTARGRSGSWDTTLKA
ncbi:hypothetical protein BOO69_17930 [Sulfitobacter alexandrii]|uniref:PNPLA domain-containing protein n=1 Tax=Sulfitobacter alexandrii TaxID=1917485 RepID=A0A1J0WL41_9RHOB|nr:patatin-like phospholipase family protein [Sulfitobacter alexandrii]APE45081.1 hypothetical protein BOO69_17930 [Sulfitobacter alexandrii]